MLESTENYVAMWMSDESIKKLMLETWAPELVPWISMAWVFKMPWEFRHKTQIVMESCKRKIGEGLEGTEDCMNEGIDLPVPDAIMLRRTTSEL